MTSIKFIHIQKISTEDDPTPSPSVWVFKNAGELERDLATFYRGETRLEKTLVGAGVASQTAAWKKPELWIAYQKWTQEPDGTAFYLGKIDVILN